MDNKLVRCIFNESIDDFFGLKKLIWVWAHYALMKNVQVASQNPILVLIRIRQLNSECKKEVFLI